MPDEERHKSSRQKYTEHQSECPCDGERQQVIQEIRRVEQRRLSICQKRRASQQVWIPEGKRSFSHTTGCESPCRIKRGYQIADLSIRLPGFGAHHSIPGW